ncbi:unnamed protein product [Onchocerca flexuosa]|uniref:Vesicular, overexpressed in cancer, prosurvival protein 1 n=1 Tax=Onchocerca flexuosa TaxID=387005 RepID=A0A183HQ47_9BILA|nr:unnamed protein product [Onchocerca flexuosa]
MRMILCWSCTIQRRQQCPEPNDTIMDHQLSEVPPLPPQAMPFLSTPPPAIPPPQGTVYFRPPYVFPDGLPESVSCEQPNVPSLLENSSTEGLTNDNGGLAQGMFFF